MGSFGVTHHTSHILCVLTCMAGDEYELQYGGGGNAHICIQIQENKLLLIYIPLTLKALVSTIKSKVTSIVKSTMIFPTMSATFCKVVGIVCNENMEIQSYATKANATLGQDHASQVITTINNFQPNFFFEENLSKGVTCNQ